MSVVCCQVESLRRTDHSFRSPTDCGASLYVIKKPRKRGGYSPIEGCEIQPPMGVVAPGKKIYLTILLLGYLESYPSCILYSYVLFSCFLLLPEKLLNPSSHNKTLQTSYSVLHIHQSLHSFKRYSLLPGAILFHTTRNIKIAIQCYTNKCHYTVSSNYIIYWQFQVQSNSATLRCGADILLRGFEL